jgi:hypothetical protein
MPMRLTPGALRARLEGRGWGRLIDDLIHQVADLHGDGASVSNSCGQGRKSPAHGRPPCYCLCVGKSTQACIVFMHRRDQRRRSDSENRPAPCLVPARISAANPTPVLVVVRPVLARAHPVSAPARPVCGARSLLVCRSPASPGACTASAPLQRHPAPSTRVTRQPSEGRPALYVTTVQSARRSDVVAARRKRVGHDGPELRRRPGLAEE